MLEERVRVANLLDIYGMLLTEKQRRILARYMLEDYSLGEIAEEEGISRQAVHESPRQSPAGQSPFSGGGDVRADTGSDWRRDQGRG